MKPIVLELLTVAAISTSAQMPKHRIRKDTEQIADALRRQIGRTRCSPMY
jgi:hypothetical protein